MTKQQAKVIGNINARKQNETANLFDAIVAKVKKHGISSDELTECYLLLKSVEEFKFKTDFEPSEVSSRVAKLREFLDFYRGKTTSKEGRQNA